MISEEVIAKNEKLTGYLESSQTKSKSFLTGTFIKWSETVDINCYTKMIDYKGNLLCQFIWLVILLISTVSTFGLIATNVLSYTQFEVVSQTSIFDENPTTFPTVTFCDNNPLTSQVAEQLLDNFTNMSRSDDYLRSTLAKMKASDPSYGDENRKKLGLSYSQVQWTSFNNKYFNNNLHWYWSFEFGNCFQFNSGFNYTNQIVDLINVTRHGVDYGAYVAVLPLIYQKKYYISFSEGLVVMVGNNSFKPSHGVFLEPGKTTYISGDIKISSNILYM